MKLLFLSSRQDIAGPLPKVLPTLEAALRDAGSDLVVLPWGRTAKTETAWQKLIRLLADLVAVAGAARVERFDALVVNTSHDWRALARDIPLLATAAVMGFRKRALVLHGSNPQLISGFRDPFSTASRLLILLCTHILVLSSDEAGRWRRLARSKQVQVIRLPRVSRPSGLKGQMPAEPSRPIFVYAGRLLEDKGIFDLLTALRKVVDRFDCEVVFAGDGPDRDRLLERARALNLERYVSCTGYLDEVKLWRLYATGTALVLPTRMTEGFPVVILEALEAGLPIITTRIRGAADWLKDGVNGFLVPPHDSSTLTEALCTLLASPALIESMRAANLELVHSFDVDVAARTWLDALESSADHSTASNARGIQ